jgi:excisionase family DNA binding protein
MSSPAVTTQSDTRATTRRGKTIPASPDWLHSLVSTARGDQVTITQLAAALGVHPFTVRRWIHDGRLESVMVGKRRRITRAAIERFLAREATPPAVQPAIPA